MKSLTGKFSSTRGWVVLLILLLGAGLFVAACGDEEVPTPTTPAPTPPAPPPTPAPEPEPEPEPVPEAPAVPVGLRVSASGMDFIEWSWNAVEGVSGYDAQYSANEAFTDEDETIPRTAEEISYRREGLEAGASAFLRVRAAAGTGEERVTSDWSTHVTGMTAEPEPELPPAPAVPANLRLKERGSNFIEWEWDEVPGAAGYESQFSADGVSFSAQVPHAGVSNTSRSVANLPAERAGHLRVRSFTGSGTGADTVRGDWSASDRQTTDEPPPAVPLATPTGLDATDESDDAIALEWSSVRNADSYEVGQREPGGSWGDASCGGADNVVEDEECVASGLNEGTDYDFRVRAVQADDDDAHTPSAWSDTVETSTTGTSQTPTTPTTAGGMGDLNIRWESDADSIIWIWDRIPGQTYDYVVEAEDEYSDSANPCVTRFDGTLTEQDSLKTSYETDGVINRDASDAGVRLLCVRTSDEENVSFAWGAISPADATNGDATLNDDGDAVTALEWTDFDVVGGFDWDAHLVADSERTNAYDVTQATVRAGRDMQNACSEGRRIDGGESDVRYTLDEIVARSGLQTYTGYVFCSRFSNTAGSSAWQVQPTKQFTYPARPPTPTVDPQRTSGQNVTWQLAVRNNTNVPRDDGDYEAKLIHYDETLPDPEDTTDPIRNIATKDPKVENCADPAAGIEADEGVWTPVVEGNTLGLSRNSAGIVVKATDIPQNSADDAETQGDTKAKLCVRATSGGGRNGPWVISGSREIKRLDPPS